MKKILIAALSAIFLLSLSACSAPGAQEASSAPSESSALAEGEASPSEGADGTDTQAVMPIYGKIKSLVGNSLTLDLAKQPQSDAASSEDSGDGSQAGIIMDSAQSVTVIGGDEEGGSEGEGDGDVIISSPEDMPKLELEYTGETKDFTIPAGLKIYDSMGKDIKIADLKEGNVLMILQNEDGSIDSIMVME